MLSDRAKDFFEVMTKMKKMHTFCSAINGIPQGEFAMMALINSHDAYLDDGQIKGVSASKISRLLSMSKSSVSQMINSLEEKGLVERYTSRDDRRMVFIRITDLGKVKMKEAVDVFIRFTGQILEEMGEHDADEFLRLLNKLCDIMERHPIPFHESAGRS